eukprot:TRINITY_DN10338_c0_g1_i1.p2 TRINITY_DN10338_c0_g1~~TRINITY_DN10338_c0_g1_i1.p2  ORF type:complete len:202 (-),score=13.37 TRINITY_DN10338_c0_g1_i1:2489-3094(-)
MSRIGSASVFLSCMSVMTSAAAWCPSLGSFNTSACIVVPGAASLYVVRSECLMRGGFLKRSRRRRADVSSESANSRSMSYLIMSFKLSKTEKNRFSIDGAKSLELWYETDVPVSRRDTIKEIRRQFNKMKASDRNVRVQVATRYEKLNWRSGKMIEDVRRHGQLPDGIIVYDGDGSVQLDDPTAHAGGITAMKITVIQNLA